MEPGKINILVAEDNDVNRGLLTGIIKTQGYNVLEAGDGSEAIRLARERDIHVAIIDQMMEPMGGFHFAQYIMANKFDVPMIMVTAHDVSDILLEASRYGITRVLQKPVAPEKILSSINRILAQRGLKTTPIATAVHSTKLSRTDLMQRAIELAAANRKSGRGGPFGAVVADAEGHILGEGANGTASRCDPTAHAEVMAIRQAVERTGEADMSGCVLFCSSEPTKISKALISSVGIEKVYYGLTHDEMEAFLGAPKPEKEIEYIRLCHEDAMAMLQSCKREKPSE
jgi:tRNA(Arg) A34 adenosine deaminase TadA